eukprot:scaffold6220_cov85-Isochrysis_galbana.AAC.1
MGDDCEARRVERCRNSGLTARRLAAARAGRTCSSNLRIGQQGVRMEHGAGTPKNRACGWEDKGVETRARGC